MPDVLVRWKGSLFLSGMRAGGTSRACRVKVLSPPRPHEGRCALGACCMDGKKGITYIQAYFQVVVCERHLCASGMPLENCTEI